MKIQAQIVTVELDRPDIEVLESALRMLWQTLQSRGAGDAELEHVNGMLQAFKTAATPVTARSCSYPPEGTA